MAQGGSLAGEEDGREVAALAAEAAVAYGVDAAVQRMQPARANAVSDLVSRQPDPLQLHSTDDAMLAGGHDRDRGIQTPRFTFGRYRRLRVKLAWHFASLRSRVLRRCAVRDGLVVACDDGLSVVGD